MDDYAKDGGAGEFGLYVVLQRSFADVKLWSSYSEDTRTCTCGSLNLI